ncbi:MAG: hypothetical protein R3E68_04635 [Burkholderiaceae bacterium]
MQLGDPAHDRQPQARTAAMLAVRARLVEQVEHPRLLVDGDPGPVSDTSMRSPSVRLTRTCTWPPRG